MRGLVLGGMLAALGGALVGGAPDRAPHDEPEPARTRPAIRRGAANAKPPIASEAAVGPTAPGAAAPTSPDAAQGGGLRKLSLDVPAMRAALAAVPALSALASDFVPFSDADADAALRRGGRSRDGIAVWTFQPAAFGWSPHAGRELWVLSGRSGMRALIAVLEPKGGRRFEHAASLVLQEPEVTVAVGYSDQYRDQLVWSTCYGCAGEGGTIRSREDGRIEFAYR